MTVRAALDDPRYAELDEAMRRHQHRADGLIEVLHLAQQRFGHLPRPVLAHVARGLNTPLSRVYGVATFYHFFSLVPPATHTVQVCTGTACYAQQAGRILDALERATGLLAGGRRADGALSIAGVRCLGPCSLGPVVVFDHELAGAVTPEAAVARVEAWSRP